MLRNSFEAKCRARKDVKYKVFYSPSQFRVVNELARSITHELAPSLLTTFGRACSLSARRLLAECSGRHHNGTLVILSIRSPHAGASVGAVDAQCAQAKARHQRRTRDHLFHWLQAHGKQRTPGAAQRTCWRCVTLATSLYVAQVCVFPSSSLSSTSIIVSFLMLAGSPYLALARHEAQADNRQIDARISPDKRSPPLVVDGAQ